MFVELKAIEGPYNGKSRVVHLKAPHYKCLFGRTVPEGTRLLFFFTRVDDFRLEADPEISGKHALFRWNLEKDCLQVCDEGSFNGTALDFKILEKGKFYDVKDGNTLTAGKSKFVIRIRENREDLQSEKAPKGDVYCPICFKDLNQMTETGRTQHVNNCLPSSEPSILSKAAQLTKNQSYECLQ